MSDGYVAEVLCVAMYVTVDVWTSIQRFIRTYSLGYVTTQQGRYRVVGMYWGMYLWDA